MFYTSASNPPQLRLGDILKQHTVVTTQIATNKKSYNDDEVIIEVVKSKYVVVLTPCCSIEDQVIVISPLIPIKVKFFENPYFATDLTNINRKMKPDQTVSQHVWENFSEEIRQQRTQVGIQYGLVDYFLYESHELLEKYILKIPGEARSIETNYYMIDFRNVTKVNSTNIRRAEGLFIGSKFAQLSIQSRGELRNKLAEYYGRPPAEDLIEE